jgi:osmotically-inducible protein OsmY
MNVASRKNILVVCAYLGSIAGLAGFAASAGAQTLVASAGNSSQSVAGSATQGAGSTTDQELRARVQAALHSEPYLYDRHIRVSADNGVVALHGLVFSAWDLQDAMRVANRTVHGKPVVDNLSIYEVGGARH